MGGGLKARKVGETKLGKNDLVRELYYSTHFAVKNFGLFWWWMDLRLACDEIKKRMMDWYIWKNDRIIIHAYTWRNKQFRRNGSFCNMVKTLHTNPTDFQRTLFVRRGSSFWWEPSTKIKTLKKGSNANDAGQSQYSTWPIHCGSWRSSCEWLYRSNG